MILLALILAATPAPGPQVHGWVLEDGGSIGVAEVEITFAQGTLVQRRHTTAAGEFRFRGFDGAGTLSMSAVPGDYTISGNGRAEVEVKSSAVAEVSFRVRGHRRVMGRISLEGNGLEGVRVVVAGHEGISDAEGNYAVLDVPAGEQKISLAARAGLPPGFVIADLPTVQVPAK